MSDDLNLKQKEQNYCKSKLSDGDPHFRGFQDLVYRIKSIIGEAELVECSRCNGEGKTHIREEWHTNCKKCDGGGVPGPAGKHPKNWKTIV